MLTRSIDIDTVTRLVRHAAECIRRSCRTARIRESSSVFLRSVSMQPSHRRLSVSRCFAYPAPLSHVRIGSPAPSVNRLSDQSRRENVSPATTRDIYPSACWCLGVRSAQFLMTQFEQRPSSDAVLQFMIIVSFVAPPCERSRIRDVGDRRGIGISLFPL